MDDVLGKPARFRTAPIAPNDDGSALVSDAVGAWNSAHTIHGIITQFDEFETTADQTRYRVVLEPKIADLNRAVTSRLFQRLTLQEIITLILRHEGYAAGVDFIFKLRGESYKRREYVTQYRETTVAFIQRICAQEGVWFRFEQKKDRAAVVFGDDMDAYARKQRVLPHRRDSGLESSGGEAIKALEKHSRRVPEAVRLNDFNHRTADVPLLVEQSAARDNATTHAVDYHWGEHYEAPEEGEHVARIRHEAHLARQLTFTGTGNPFWLEAGEVLGIDPSPSDAPHGVFVTAIEVQGSRTAPFWMSFEGIPADRVWRTHMDTIARPVVDGVLPARVASPGGYKYAYLDEHGRYVVKLPFDLDEWSPGGTSRPVRMAKPYSGAKYGHHFPLIDGAEVALIFTNGDPDRPIIVGAMHNSEQADLVNSENKTRNLIVTAAGNVQRMEDLQDAEHVHLSTPYAASELNLGHMVDTEGNPRGKGTELRSQGRTSVRGEKGVLISAESHASASDHQLAMQGAQRLLDLALQRMRSLGEAASFAEAVASDYERQRVLLDETLTDLKKSGVLVSAPEGIGMASGSDVQLAAEHHLIATAGANADIGVMKRFTVAAGELISLFAQKLGIKLIAARGKVEMQAQSDEMLLTSDKDMRVTSANGRVVIEAKSELLLKCGGSYLRLSANGIEDGTQGDRTVKSAAFRREGPSSLGEAMNTWKHATLDEQFTLQWPFDGSPVANRTFSIIREDGSVIRGLTDASGKTGLQKSIFADGVRLRIDP